jgi:hypothetical protein
MSDDVVTTGFGHGVRLRPWLVGCAQPCDVVHPFLRSRCLRETALDVSSSASVFDAKLVHFVVVRSRVVQVWLSFSLF